ncbi:hypothetical protein skT53_29450 [Effusibacillus dendaii]|uniref:DNA (cytosine-5-)-methyltransferase n=2 Tax=Effusibacillus dendaii TaxID=2743772 RepID=A0A7I8DH78_9BACL|nr:hypothetical protein skT53_29450 [Effusibacillus dendaii]
MFPEMIRAVREIRPEVILIENVKGLLRKSFSTYLEYILLQITYPETVLPNPEFEDIGNMIPNHEYRPGARVYPGHTGSLLDEPAKTLKAGDHGVPGGENMLVRLDGSVLYDPGSGRYNQKRSLWDVIHPGRSWALKLQDRKDRCKKYLQKSNSSSISKLYAFKE